MIDEISPHGTGWARFSDDRSRRYVIGRALTPRVIELGFNVWSDVVPMPLSKVTFCMINPSKAGAIGTDPTWTKVCKFASLWGFDIVEGVNLHAHISAYPEDLWRFPIGQRGDDADNDAQILERCVDAGAKVVAAWGNHGERDNRGAHVRSNLIAHGVQLHRFEGPLTDSGQPKHPLARGKHHIPMTATYVPWVMQ